MTRADLDFLLTTEARELVEMHLADRPEAVALKTRQPALATQVKYLQRAKTKLPSWFAARAIVPPLAFEQCSSELAAFSKNMAGETCLDLTCGLGVDSFSFSKKFKKVVAIERDPVLAEVVRHNFKLMGVENIEILTGAAEDFIKNWTGEPFDWIYLDPARRDERGKKMFLPADCVPDLLPILPVLKKIGQQILVKYSPMLDVDAAARLFPGVAEIEVLSIGNECKEVLLKFTKTDHFSPKIRVKCGQGGQFFEFEKNENAATKLENQIDFDPKTAKFIIEPDVAFYKTRLVGAFFEQFFPEFIGELTSPDGFFISKNKVEKCPARQFKIIEQLDWQPKKLTVYFKKKGIARLNVVVRSFPQSAAEVRKQLNMAEGGNEFLILTGKRAWFCEKSDGII